MHAPQRMQLSDRGNRRSAGCGCGRCRPARCAARRRASGPWKCDEYVVIGWPVAERASSRRKTPRSCARGISFSMPMQAMCSFGSETPRSALPSFVQTTKPPVSAMAKLTPVMPASASRNLSRRCARAASARYFGSVAPSCGAQVLVEQLADLFLLDVNRRQHDVAGRLVPQLHDPFAQVGVDDFDAVPLQVRIQVAFFGEHRLALDELLHAVSLQDLQHDLVVLGGIAGPVHVGAQPRGVAPRIAPGSRPAGDSVCSLICEASSRSRSHSGTRLRRLVALGPHEPQRLVVPVRPLAVGDELRSLIGVIALGHVVMSHDSSNSESSGMRGSFNRDANGVRGVADGRLHSTRPAGSAVKRAAAVPQKSRRRASRECLSGSGGSARPGASGRTCRPP